MGALEKFIVVADVINFQFWWPSQHHLLLALHCVSIVNAYILPANGYPYPTFFGLLPLVNVRRPRLHH